MFWPLFLRHRRFTLPAAAWTLSVQALNLLSQLFIDIIIARELGPQLAGEVIFAFSVSGMLSIFTLFGAGEIAIQLYNQRRTPPEQIWTAMLGIWSVGTCSCLLLSCAIIWATKLPWDGQLSVLAAMSVLAINGLSSIFNHILVSWDLSKHDIPGLLGSRALMVLGVLIAAHMRSLEAVWAAYLIGAIAQLAWRARTCHKLAFKLRYQPSAQTLRLLWSRSKHVGLSSIFGTIATRADVSILRFMADAHACGLYGAAYRVISGINMLSSSVAFALFPFLSRPDPDGQYRIYRKLFAILPIFGCLGLWFVAAFLAKPAMALVFGDAFQAAGVMLQWLMLAASVQLIQSFLARYIITLGLERALPWASISSALLNISMLLWLIPSQGAMGAVWASLAGDLAGLLTLAVGATRLRLKTR